MIRLYFDGSENRWGFMLEGCAIPISYVGEYLGTSMETEYHGLIAGLKKAISLGVSELEIYGDSQVVINQVLGASSAKGKEKTLRDTARNLMDLIPNFTIKHIDRKFNKADELLR